METIFRIFGNAAITGSENNRQVNPHPRTHFSEVVRGMVVVPACGWHAKGL